MKGKMKEFPNRFDEVYNKYTISIQSYNRIR